MPQKSILAAKPGGSNTTVKVQNPRPNVNAAALSAVVDRSMAALYFECMEQQKERIRVLLNSVWAMVKDQDDEDVKTLVSLAQHLCEDHSAWYSLGETLGWDETNGDRGSLGGETA